jgi:hypothetical protein
MEPRYEAAHSHENDRERQVIGQPLETPAGKVALPPGRMLASREHMRRPLLTGRLAGAVLSFILARYRLRRLAGIAAHNGSVVLPWTALLVLTGTLAFAMGQGVVHGPFGPLASDNDNVEPAVRPWSPAALVVPTEPGGAVGDPFFRGWLRCQDARGLPHPT